jgi:AraC-like DNA-binding protein
MKAENAQSPLPAATVQRWELQSLQVELLSILENIAEPRREVVTEAHWQLVYMLDGDLIECVMDDTGHHFHLHIAEGGCSLRYFPRGFTLSDYSKEANRRQLLIRFTETELLGQGRLWREAEIAKRSGIVATLTIPVNRQMQQLAAAIQSNKKEATNCILPVLASTLALLQQVVLSREFTQISAVEREKNAVETACGILESRLDNPPSLEELAAQVGMSVTSFKSVFSRIYGMPPFAYLRDLRLERAMCLLQNEGLRVTEAALEVGYNNLSHFAKIFEARFGLTPSRVRLK